MPLISVKMFTGRTQEQKVKLADALAKAASEAIDTPYGSFTVGIEDVDQDIWEETVRNNTDVWPSGEKLYILRGEKKQ